MKIEKIIKLQIANCRLDGRSIRHSLFSILYSIFLRSLQYSLFNIRYSKFITHNSKLLTLNSKLLTLNSKLLTLSILLSLSSIVSFSQNIDSLKLALQNAKHDSTRCFVLSELSNVCEVEEILKYANPCVALCKNNLQNKKLTNHETLSYKKHLADAYSNIGFLAQQHGDIQKALDYGNKSLLLRKEIMDKKGVGMSLNNIGLIYNKLGDIKKALEYYYQSLKIQEEINDKEGIAMSLNNIGYNYKKQGDTYKSLEYFNKSLKFHEAIKDKYGIAMSLNNIGYIYDNQAEQMRSPDSTYRREQLTSKALECYNKSLKIREEINDKKGIAYSLNNIGVIYDKQAEQLSSRSSTAQRNQLSNKALEYYYNSLKIRKEINDKDGIANSTSNIAGSYLKQNNITEALKYGNLSMQTAKELGYPEQIRSSAGMLKHIYQKQNKFKEALEMFELEILMRDSMSNEATKKTSIKKQFQYQYEKKAAADSVKNSEEQKVKNAQLMAQAAQLKEERTQRFALYGGLALVIAFSGFVFNRFKITQKQKKIIESQKHEVDSAYEKLHEKNKEVMDSIQYAARIQRSLITNEKYIANQFKKLNKL